MSDTPPPAPPMGGSSAASRGAKTLLTITAVSRPKIGPMQIINSRSFTAAVNPSTFSQTETIRYNEAKTLGQIKPAPTFASVGSTKVAFELLLDGTGAVPIGAGQKRVEVEDQVNQLTAIVYTYAGKKHEPNPVQVLWGTLIFYGRLTSLSMRYTLFKPSGAPLRALAAMDFTGYTDRREAAAEARPSSPDLTHRVTVRQGDTLPLLCARIYGDPAYYLEVARYNRLASFRELTPGRQLHFPPLG